MAKIFRLALVLTAITAISGFALAFIKDLTAEQIEINKIKAVKAPAVADVFAGVKPANDPLKDLRKIVAGKDKSGRDFMVYVFPAKKDGKIVAVALETFGSGYHEGLGVMTAIGVAGPQAGKILGIAITSHSETPGRGDKVALPDFRKQFAGRSIDQEVAKGNVDAVSGATRSTEGVIEAINKAIEIYKKNKDKLVS